MAGLAALWGAHTFLSVAKEKCAKESQRHGDSRGGPPHFALRLSPALRLCLATRFMASGGASRPSASLGGGLRPAVAPSGLSSSSVRFAHPPGKSPLLPILTAGLAMSRAAELASLRMLSCALGARLFPPSKWAGLFPSAAYRRSAPPQLAVGKLNHCGLGCIPWLGGFEASRNEGFCSAVGGAGQAEPLRGGMVSCWLADFGRSSASGFGARAARPVAERR